MAPTTATGSLYDELRSRVRGPVLRGGDRAAAGEAAGFQLGLRHRPEVLVGATETADVTAAVAASAARGLPLTVHATGHGLRSPAEGGVLLTTRRLDRVEIDPAARVARLGAGVRGGTLTTAAARYGLMPPSGSFPGVGVVGYTFGGGIGLLARSDGWATDHVRAFTVVSDGGEVKEVTAESDLRRFARLRGSGPLPGEVVTAMTIGLLPEGTLTGGGLLFDLGPTGAPGDPGPLHAYREWTAGLPDEITTALSVINYPDWAMLPPFLRGRRIARVSLTARADPDRTGRLLAPLRVAGAPVRDTVGPLRSTESARVHAEPDDPHAYTGENLLLDALTPAGLDALADLDGPMTVVNVRHLGGTLARPAVAPDTVPARDAAYLVSALSPLDPATALDDPPAAAAEVDPARALHGFAAAEVGVSRSFEYGPRARA